MTHGLEVMPIKKECTKWKQYNILKQLQGLPKQVANTAVSLYINWGSTHQYGDRQKYTIFVDKHN